jgi:hypothetical protein
MISRRLQSLTELVPDTGTTTLRPFLLLWAARLRFLECWIQELVQRKRQPEERSTINELVGKESRQHKIISSLLKRILDYSSLTKRALSC